MNKKRFIILTLAFLLLSAMLLSGCTQGGTDNKISIVCTVFPQYDWVRQILGDKRGDMEVTLLLDNKIDLHNYQPAVNDIVKISTCDLFIYVGGESDLWVEAALKEAVNQDMIVINLISLLGDAAKIEEVIEGMESDHENEDEEDDHEEEAAFDEHVWLSLKNAQTFCVAIADALSALNADNTEVYQNNLTMYLQNLATLDAEYQAAVSTAPTKTLLFGDRFPFRYLVDDYGLDYYAAFEGCSAETEAGFETIIFLAGKVDELRLRNIVVTESGDQSIAKTIRDNTAEKNQQILVLNAIQSVASDDVTKGMTYLSLMESNLSVLREALQ